MGSFQRRDKMNEESYNAFLHELKIFHQNRGSPFHNVPKINGREINLLTFYNVVTGAGGFKLVTEQRKWNDVASILKFPRGCVNISLSLRKIYVRYLKHYEKMHFMKQQKNEDVKAGPQIKKLKFCQDAPMVYNAAQHDISDVSRATFGLNKTFVSPNNYIKLCMSLLCGLPNEQELALNICILLSSKENFNFDLSQSPKLVDFLIAQGGVWDPNDDALKTLHLDSWKNVKGRNMVWFWKSVLDIRNDELAQFLGSGVNEVGSDESLLNISQGIWYPSYEGELVFKVSVIIYNLSFEKKNKSVLVNNRSLLRFLLLCIHSSWGTLKQTAYDTLGNIAMELKISTEHDMCSRIILQTVVDGISSSDRFIVIKSVDILSQLCCCLANEDVITSLLNEEVYHQLLLFLTVHDVVLLTHSLDALYALSDLGKYPCDKIASGHHFIATLVSLLTCEASEFEQSAYINMKIIKTAYPVELDLNKEVTSTKTEALKPVSSSTSGPEDIVCKWLRDKYEINQNCSCSEDHMFSQYVTFCNKFGARQASLSLFRTCVQSSFPDCNLKMAKNKIGVEALRYYGIRKKPVNSAICKTNKNLNDSQSSHRISLVVDSPTQNMKGLDMQTHRYFKSVSQNQKHSTNEINTKMAEERNAFSSVVSCNAVLPESNTSNQNSIPGKKVLQGTVPDLIVPSIKQKLTPCGSIEEMKIFSGNSVATDMQHVEEGKTANCVDAQASIPAAFISLKQKLLYKISEGFANNPKMKTNANEGILSTANDSALLKYHLSNNMTPKASCSSNTLINSIPLDSVAALNGMTQNAKPFASSIESSNEVSCDKFDLSTSSTNNTMNNQLIPSNISSSSMFSNSPDEQNDNYSPVKKFGLQSDTIMSKSPLLSSILNKGTELTAKNKSDVGTGNILSLKDSNLKVMSNVQETTCYKAFPISSVNATFQTASHNFETSSLAQNAFIATLATENSATPNALACLDVLPALPIYVPNCNNVAFEMKTGKNNIVILHVKNPENSVQKVNLVPIQSSQQIFNIVPSNTISPNKQIEGESAAITHILNNFSEGKEAVNVCGVAGVISSKNLSHAISGDSNVSNNSQKSNVTENFDTITEKCSKETHTDSPLHQRKRPLSPVENCNEHSPATVVPCSGSSSLKEVKQQLFPNVASEQLKYSCNWKNCGLKFSKISSMYLHISQVHVPASNDDMICLWDGCGPLKRKRMSLLTHLQDWHCNEASLKSESMKKQQLPVGRKSAVPPPPPHCGYSSDAAIIAIKRRALQDIDPNKQFANKKPLNEKEQALEESIHLTSALILRNLVSYSPMARTYIRRFESELVHLAMSQTESSNILAQCLSYLT